MHIVDNLRLIYTAAKVQQAYQRIDKSASEFKTAWVSARLLIITQCYQVFVCLCRRSTLESSTACTHCAINRMLASCCTWRGLHPVGGRAGHCGCSAHKSAHDVVMPQTHHQMRHLAQTGSVSEAAHPSLQLTRP